MTAEHRFSAVAEKVLRASGWTPGRAVDTSKWQAGFQRAGHAMPVCVVDFLTEFGGIVVTESGTGITTAREPFEIDPALGDYEWDRFEDWSEQLGIFVMPLGELDGGRYFLGIDSDGNIYVMSDWIARYGKLDEGLEAILTGIQPYRLG
ncbi:hypothetical protein D5S17_29500 [Pseudonocardiaceae bacterium YIM PH 21723]|nr:hypothetical protein D5S17_29500 [Pseudonocardiaceae bacterium YIM PH 21723]